VCDSEGEGRRERGGGGEGVRGGGGEMRARNKERASERESESESFTTTHVSTTTGAAPSTATRTEEKNRQYRATTLRGPICICKLGVVGLAPDIGERQRGCFQGSHSHWKGPLQSSLGPIPLSLSNRPALRKEFLFGFRTALFPLQVCTRNGGNQVASI